MSKLLYGNITHDIIGAYYEVYNHTSRIFPESIYEEAMIVEIKLRGHSVKMQDEYPIYYKGYLVGFQILDLFVDDKIVIENKVVERLTALHKAQCISYLKTVDKQVGVMLNFGGEKPEFERVYFNPAERTVLQANQPASPTHQLNGDLLYPALCHEIINALYEVHDTLGPGFVHRIYKNASYRELRLRGLDCKAHKKVQVVYKSQAIGEVSFGHINVINKILVFPVAIRDMRLIHLNNLRNWMRLANIRLGILVNFNGVRLDVGFLRI